MNDDARPSLPQPFADLMTTGWAEPDENSLAPIEQAELTAARRRKLSANFPGETLVIPTGALKTRSSDTDYEFRPGSDFAYLTGCYEEDSVLVMTPAHEGTHDEVLFIRARSPRTSDEFFTRAHGELWVGPRHTLGGYSTIYGISCKDLETFGEFLDTIIRGTTRVRRGLDRWVDAAIPEETPLNAEAQRPDPEEVLNAPPAEGPAQHHQPAAARSEASTQDEGEASPTTKESTKLSRDAELAAVLAEMRMVKDEWEIAQLQDAVDATIRGFQDIARALASDRDTPERLLDGIFSLRARHDGNTVGYGNIVASGQHACTLHWWRNNGTCTPGELLLVDAGVENVHYYTADITRTIPISGRFTEEQRRIYDIVEAAQRAGFAAVKPGATWKDVHMECMRVLAEGLERLGILPIPAEGALDKENQTYRRWTLHTFGHALGIDVHDCNDARDEEYRTGTLKPGMVLTVEPGLYFQPDDLLVPDEYRGIGIRIEDDVLVTETGCEVLSEALPRQADALESWLAARRQEPYRLP